MFPRRFIPYQPNGWKLPSTPWLCAYWPVMNVALDGQHSGNESTALEKLVPFAARYRRTLGIFATSASAWSSVITTRMFGRPSFAAPAGRASAAAGQSSRRTRTASERAAIWFETRHAD